MAKSIRSKWKRKCRAVKRVRYGQKELERLKKTLGVDENNVDMNSLTDVVTVISKKNIRPIVENKGLSNSMDVDKKRVFNLKTMKDQHGTYPVWMHQRRIRRNKKIEKKKKSKRKH